MSSGCEFCRNGPSRFLPHPHFELFFVCFRMKQKKQKTESSHHILLNLDPDLVSSSLGTFDTLLQWWRRVSQVFLHQVLKQICQVRFKSHGYTLPQTCFHKFTSASTKKPNQSTETWGSTTELNVFCLVLLSGKNPPGNIFISWYKSFAYVWEFYLKFGFFLLQHFPEYLSGMFLYFWVLEMKVEKLYFTRGNAKALITGKKRALTCTSKTQKENSPRNNLRSER